MRDLLDLKNARPGESDDKPEQEYAEDFSILPEIVSWEAVRSISDVAHRRRHIIIVAAVILGVVIALWQSSWLTFFAIALGLIGWEIIDRIVYPIKADADHQGLTLNGRHYPYTELASFDIHKMPDDVYELSLKTRHWHTPHLRIPLGEQDPEDVHALLSQYVINEPHSIPLLDYWLRR